MKDSGSVKHYRRTLKCIVTYEPLNYGVKTTSGAVVKEEESLIYICDVDAAVRFYLDDVKNEMQ